MAVKKSPTKKIEVKCDVCMVMSRKVRYVVVMVERDDNHFGVAICQNCIKEMSDSIKQESFGETLQ